MCIQTQAPVDGSRAGEEKLGKGKGDWETRCDATPWRRVPRALGEGKILASQDESSAQVNGHISRELQRT